MALKRALKPRPLDLNSPTDARIYVLGWVDKDPSNFQAPAEMLRGSDEDILMVDKQLFMHADEREALGTHH